MLKAHDGAVHGVLDGLGQAGGEPLEIHLLGVLAAGLHKDRVALLVFEADHLVLDGGAVPGPHALDVAAVEGRAVQVVQNHLVGLGVGVGDVAVDLVVHGRPGQKAEGLEQLVGVAGLAFQLGEINAAAMDPGGGAGLEAAQREPVGHQRLGQLGGGVGAVGAAVVVGLPHKDAAAQRGAGGNDAAVAAVVAAQRRHNAHNVAVLHIHAGDLRLVDVEVFGFFQGVLHPDVIPLAVGLHPQTVDRRPLAPVEHPALQKGGVSAQAHQPAQGVHFPHQMPLGGAANRRVAGHVADKVQRQREDGGLGAQHRRRVGGLDARMARAHHDHVIVSQNIHKCKFPSIEDVLPLFGQDALGADVVPVVVVGVHQHRQGGPAVEIGRGVKPQAVALKDIDLAVGGVARLALQH